MIDLTEQLQEILDNSPGIPVWLVDPRTRQAYVLLKEEEYEQVKSILGYDDGLDGIDGGRLITEAMREDDENDPVLESYQKYKDSP